MTVRSCGRGTRFQTLLLSNWLNFSCIEIIQSGSPKASLIFLGTTRDRYAEKAHIFHTLDLVWITNSNVWGCFEWDENFDVSSHEPEDFESILMLEYLMFLSLFLLVYFQFLEDLSYLWYYPHLIVNLPMVLEDIQQDYSILLLCFHQKNMHTFFHLICSSVEYFIRFSLCWIS